MPKGERYLMIYFTYDKKSYQMVKPSMTGEDKFNGDWRKLVDDITNGIYHSFEII